MAIGKVKVGRSPPWGGLCGSRLVVELKAKSFAVGLVRKMYLKPRSVLGSELEPSSKYGIPDNFIFMLAHCLLVWQFFFC